MTRMLLIGFVILAESGHPTVGASEPGTAPPTNGIVPGATIQVVPTPTFEQKLLITTRVTQEVQAPLEAPAFSELPNPEIICGTKVWRVDPSLDPGIRKPLPEGGPEARIRRIPAQECSPGASTMGQYGYESWVVIKELPAGPAVPVRK